MIPTIEKTLGPRQVQKICDVHSEIPHFELCLGKDNFYKSIII